MNRRIEKTQALRVMTSLGGAVTTHSMARHSTAQTEKTEAMECRADEKQDAGTV